MVIINIMCPVAEIKPEYSYSQIIKNTILENSTRNTEKTYHVVYDFLTSEYRNILIILENGTETSILNTFLTINLPEGTIILISETKTLPKNLVEKLNME